MKFQRLSVDDYRQRYGGSFHVPAEAPPRQHPERDLQDEIVKAAKALGYLSYHTHDSRRSAEGFPDLTLVSGRGFVLFLECKAEKGVVSNAQQEWLDRLGLDHYAGVARPSDLARVLEALEEYA